MLFLLLAHLAHADSFLTSVALPSSSPLPEAGPCVAEVARLASNGDAFEHAMVLGACHGYDANAALVATVAAGGGALHDLDVGWTGMYEATYGGATTRAADKAMRAALAGRPDDPRVKLVGALVLAQEAMFVKGGDWDRKTRRTREVVTLVRDAARLGGSDPTFRAGLDAAVEYLVLYGAFAELADLAAAR